VLPIAVPVSSLVNREFIGAWLAAGCALRQKKGLRSFGQSFIIGVMSPTQAEFKKALVSLEKALSLPEDDVSRDASIQRFEFCVELAWKSAKKMMGTSTTAPKQVVREMAQARLIDDVVFWLTAIDQRNLSSHTYNERLAKEVYGFAQRFLPAAQELSNRLEREGD